MMENFIKQCRAVESEEQLKNIFHDACNDVISGKTRHETLAAAFAEVTSFIPATPTILLDIFLLCDFETQVHEDKEQRDQFLALIKSCCNIGVSDSLLKERLDYDTTGDAGIIPNKKSASTKFIKLKTRLYYKQQKFNLFREESEGYAKLIAELCQDGDFDVEFMHKVIRSLIGCFNLDPNRVLDVILECFECRLYRQNLYIPLLQKFLDSSLTFSQILAFKFSFYQNDISLVTPESLYEITALLLHYQLIELHELYPYLNPSDNVLYEYHKNDFDDAKSSAKKANLISADDRSDENKLTDTEKHSLFANNQKMGLCLAILKIGDWIHAKELINKLPEYFSLSNVKISNQLCKLIHYGLDKIYKEKSGLPNAIVSKIKPYECERKPLLKQAESLEDLKTSVFPMIIALGPYLSQDALLMAKIIRVGKSVALSSNEQLKFELLTVIDEAVLPSMTLVDSNCGLSEELWLLIKCYSYEYRYRLYTNWKSEPTNSLLMRSRTATLKKIKYIMKRLSKENVKLSGRQIGKLSHSNPSFLFEYILSQIQSYDNLIGPVVDSLKYLTAISYDVLIFCVIEALANPSKERTKHDGATISPWLLSLANFCGSVVKKYPVELPGLLQFVANQLKAEKSLDLLILKDIVQKMAGIEATEEMTNDQLAAMSGGELLRAEGGYFNQVRNTKKSSMRLKDALLEQNLAMPLCILMAQQRNCILYHEQEHSHLKLVGKLYDQCQETLVQYGAFLSSNLSIDDYIGRLPPLDKLIKDYNLSADVAFFLVRPMIVHNITIKFDELRKGDRSQKFAQAYIDAWEHVTKPIVNSIVPACGQKFWDDLSPRFFATFWTLTMYDLEVPKNSYDKETERLKSQIQQTEDNKDLNASKRKKEVERCRLLLEKLLEEQLRQDEHVKRIKQRLEKEKDQWFQSKLAKLEMTSQFLQHCLFPRCIFTASDALYCGKFVHLLHTLKTPNFSTLICYDRIFGDISYTMCSCTENEANHYGRFLCALLDTVMRWHKDKFAFDKECAKYPGFVTKFCDKDPIHVDYENYRHVCHKWHYRLTKAFILCLDSQDYIQIRNSLIVLTKVLPHFPVMISFAQAIERRVDTIRNEEKDKRPDLYALATGYSGQLKLKKSLFVPESEFHLKEVKKLQQSTIVKSDAIVPRKNTIKTEVTTTNSSTKSISVKEKREVSKQKINMDSNDVNEKKKESRSENLNKSIKREDKSKFNSDKGKTSLSAASSPRKNTDRGRSAEPNDPDREYKRRKTDNIKNHEDNGRERDRDRETHEKRKGDDSASSSPSNTRTHEKKSNSARKRDISEESLTEPIKRRKDEDSGKSKRSNNEDKDNNKKSSETKRSISSSRRLRSDEK